MKKTTNSSPYQFEGRIPLSQAIPLGLQHVMAMFIGNLTPLIIVMGACGLTADAGFAELRTALLQNAMIIAGIVTLVQMFSIGPVGGKVPIVMGTSSGFLGVLNNTVAACGGGVIAYGAIMGACLVGGIFEGILGAFLKPLRKFFPAIVTGSVVIAIGLSLLGVGINYFCGGTGKNDYGSLPNLFIGMVVLQIIVAIIPGEPLEIGAGYAFGVFEGTLLCMIGILIGSTLVFLFTRFFGVKFVEAIYPREKFMKYKFLQNKKKLNLITFILFLIPGTPKDVLTYFIGLTPMKLSTWILITCTARIPSVVTSTIGGNALGLKDYKYAIIAFAIAVVISVIGLFIHRLINKVHNKSTITESNQQE